jgi:hypothetical protein
MISGSGQGTRDHVATSSGASQLAAAGGSRPAMRVAVASSRTVFM